MTQKERKNSKCKIEECNDGICASPRDAKKRYCVCNKGFSGKFCDWNESQLKEAKSLVSNALDALTAASVGEGAQDTVVDSVSALTDNPDLISKDAAKMAMSVLENTSAVDLSPDSASKAVGSLSNILMATSESTDGDEGESATVVASKADQKANSQKFVKLAGSLLDSVDLSTFDELGDAGFEVDSPLIKSRKVALDPLEGVAVKTKDKGGLAMDADALSKALGGEAATVNLNSFDTNIYAYDEEIATQGASGTVSVSFKSGRSEIPVKDTQVTVAMEIKNEQELSKFACGWWDTANDKMVTDDCTLGGVGEGVVSCVCPHLTDFLSVYTDKIIAKFKDGNWEYFGPPKYVKPPLENTSLYFVFF